MTIIGNSVTVQNSTSISINSTQHQALFLTGNRTLEPFSGSNIEGWYVISTPSLENLVLHRDTYRNIFSLLWNIRDPDLLAEANVDIQHLNKVRNPTQPIPNTSTISSHTWKKVMDVSSQEYYYSLVPYLSSQHIYGYLGYFAYLVFLYYNIDNTIFKLTYNTQDISATVSNILGASFESLPTIHSPTTTNTITPNSFFIPTNDALDNPQLFANYTKIFLNQTFTIRNNLLDINLPSFFSMMSLSYKRWPTALDASNALSTAVGNDNFHYHIAVCANGDVETRDFSISPPTLNVGYSLSQFPNSWIDFNIEGFIILTSSNTIICGSSQLSPALGSIANTLYNNFNNFINIGSKNTSRSITTPATSNTVASSTTITTNTIRQFTINLESVLQLFDGTTADIRNFTAITLLVQPFIYFNGGHPNNFSGGKTLKPHAIIKKKLPPLTEQITAEMTIQGSATLDNMIRGVVNGTITTTAGGTDLENNNNKSSMDNVITNMVTGAAGDPTAITKENAYSTLQSYLSSHTSLSDITFTLDSELRTSVYVSSSGSSSKVNGNAKVSGVTQ